MTLTRRLLMGAAFAAIFAALALMATGTAKAADFSVDSTADAVDASPGNGVCATLLGRCTLRAAIQETNALPGADTITMSAGTYTLAIPPAPGDALVTSDVGATADPASGDLDITGDLTIRGAGAASTMVDGAHLDRVFEIPDTPVTVHISGLTVQNGSERGALGAGGIGSIAGIVTLSNVVVRNNATTGFGGGVGIVGGVLTLVDCAVSDNTSAQAGGGFAFAGGDVTLIRSIVSGNSTAPDFGGGGFGNGADSLTLIDSTVSGNTTGIQGGGGIATATSPGQTVALIRSTITGNTTTGPGGGLNLVHPTINLVLEGSTVSDNTAGTTGGGISSNGGTVTITDSTISGNTAALSGGAANIGGTMTLERVTVTDNLSTAAPVGGVGNAGGTLTILDSSITRNVSALDAGGVGGPGVTLIDGTTISNNFAAGFGGGIGEPSGSYTVRDSTISGNTSALGGGGIASAGILGVVNTTISGNSTPLSGGGIGIIGTSATVTLKNATVTENTVDSDGDGVGDGGGTNSPLGGLSLDNTIVAGNADPGGEAPDCSGSLDSAGYNLIQNTTGCVIVSGPGDINGQPANLASLADNGGSTQTHALLANSPAIDAGNPDRPGSTDFACDPQDQRGSHRPQDGDGDGKPRCDIGAYELGVFTSTLGKVTGGGAIPDAGGSGKASFGFSVTSVAAATGSGQGISGALVYADEAADIEISGVSFDQLTISGNHAVFAGTADVNGVAERISVTVDDLGEPGRADTFALEVLEPGGYSNGPKTLSGGNIKIH